MHKTRVIQRKQVKVCPKYSQRCYITQQTLHNGNGEGSNYDFLGNAMRRPLSLLDFMNDKEIIASNRWVSKAGTLNMTDLTTVAMLS